MTAGAPEGLASGAEPAATIGAHGQAPDAPGEGCSNRLRHGRPDASTTRRAAAYTDMAVGGVCPVADWAPSMSQIDPVKALGNPMNRILLTQPLNQPPYVAEQQSVYPLDGVPVV